MRVWLNYVGNRAFKFRFQLTHPWGCDNWRCWDQWLGSCYISTHTPVRVWRNAWPPQRRTWHFNSHTREGVTWLNNMVTRYGLISTHTPVRVWQEDKAIFGRYYWFQLTHPWGCDAYFFGFRQYLFNFNSHTREGVTWLIRSTQAEGVIFQLTHPWGCDYSNKKCELLTKHFNSHTREGVTGLFILYSYGCRISTHTPVRVWRNMKRCSRLLKISTHTPVRVWPKLENLKKRAEDFNSHTREGVTWYG